MHEIRFWASPRYLVLGCMAFDDIIAVNFDLALHVLSYLKETSFICQIIDCFDAFVFVTPEYNHGIPGALKNAIDFLYREWNNKAPGFVSYGSAGGVRSVEHLRLVMAELQVADVRAQVTLSLFTDFENFTTFKPAGFQEQAVNTLMDQVIAWGSALKALRTKN
jgi:NAD(P)H-dependent FMN reductase